MSDVAKNIAEIAKQISEPTRASILVALMQGKALTAGEIALITNLSAQQASNHFSKLRKSGFITCISEGRHRYYKIDDPLVAQAIENLSLLTNVEKTKVPRHSHISKRMCLLRTCYDHLAGTVGVLIFVQLLELNYITKKGDSYSLTELGENLFRETFSIDLPTLRNKKRQFLRPCLDWTERSFHLGGSLGQALLQYMLSNRWVFQSKEARVLQLTSLGRLKLKEIFHIKI